MAKRTRYQGRPRKKELHKVQTQLAHIGIRDFNGETTVAGHPVCIGVTRVGEIGNGSVERFGIF